MRRVVITGMGLITPLGIGVDANWQALLAGRSGVRRITRFDCSQLNTQIAGEVEGFDPLRWFDKREALSIDRYMQMGIAAAQLALEDAGLPLRFDGEEAHRVGCYIGAGLAGLETIEVTHSAYLEKGPRYGISPFAMPGLLTNLVPGRVAIRHNIRGPLLAHVTACSTGAHAIGEAARAIRWGDCDAVVAGGSEAPLTALGIGAFNALRALSSRNDAPQQASRPFDRNRDGFVIAEGAGIVILEELERARRRGARIYAEVAGYGNTCDAHHVTQPSPDGDGARRCMLRALEDARLGPDAIGYINAHGTATRNNDPTETMAIKAAFGERAARLPVSSTKSMTGHLLGAAGTVEASYAALALHNGALPPTINYETPDPDCDLDYVPNTAREVRVQHVMTNSFGFGGTNVSLVLSQPNPG